MDYCDCNEFCERAQWIIEKDGSRTGWYTPYIPEIFGGPSPRCKKAAKVEDLPGRTETREEYEQRSTKS